MTSPSSSACPFVGVGKEATAAAVCPLGYDSASFKLGPLSCVVCRALLFDAARCLPCRHVYCSACIGRFKDCPLCGVDIAGLEEDKELQKLVDQFIQGHARYKASRQNEELPVAYEDSSLAGGSFLLQHAMRAFQAQNLESAKSRLELCAYDKREVLAMKGSSPETCSQLGAVLGLLGDCLRSMGDLTGAMDKYSQSASILDSIADDDKDTEMIHALSVSLNKLGDMKYYAKDLESAHGFYKRALEVRTRAGGGDDSNRLSAQSIDVVVSLAKVADVERAMGREEEANQGFAQAVKQLQGLKPSGNAALEKRRISVLDFLLHAAAEKKNDC